MTIWLQNYPNSLINMVFFSEYKVKSGDNIIRQGDDGDNFYVVESGLYNIYVNTANGNQLVGKCEDSGSFGELALMYNSKFVFKPNRIQI